MIPSTDLLLTTQHLFVPIFGDSTVALHSSVSRCLARFTCHRKIVFKSYNLLTKCLKIIINIFYCY